MKMLFNKFKHVVPDVTKLKPKVLAVVRSGTTMLNNEASNKRELHSNTLEVPNVTTPNHLTMVGS